MIQGKKPNTLLLTGALACGAIGYVFLVFVPGQKVVSGMRTQLRQQQEKVIEADRVTFDIQQIEERLKLVREFKNQWQESAPKESKIIAVNKAISGFARAAQADLREFKPATVTRMGTLSLVPFDLDVIGRYHEHLAFLSKIENSKLPVWIKNVEFAPITPESETLRCRLSLTIFADNRSDSD